MDASAKGQVNRSAADVYEEFFVPALFQHWPGPMAEAAAIGPNDRVLDVACGTGVMAREAARRVGPDGAVTGLDINDGMLAVAARMAPQIDWRHGQAEALPFAAASFDVVTCQFGLMFFADRVGGLREMWRVLHPGGRLAVAVWDGIETSPGYAAMIALLQDLFGARTADALRAPFCLGDRTELAALFADAGIPATIATETSTTQFPSLESWVHTDVRGWTLADLIDNRQYQQLQAAAGERLARFVDADGGVRFAAPAHIVTARKA